MAVAVMARAIAVARSTQIRLYKFRKSFWKSQSWIFSIQVRGPFLSFMSWVAESSRELVVGKLSSLVIIRGGGGGGCCCTVVVANTWLGEITRIVVGCMRFVFVIGITVGPPACTTIGLITDIFVFLCVCCFSLSFSLDENSRLITQ